MILELVSFGRPLTLLNGDFQKGTNVAQKGDIERIAFVVEHGKNLLKQSVTPHNSFGGICDS